MNILPINPVGVIRLEFSSFGCTRAILHKTLNFGHVILFHNNHPQQRGLSQTWQSQRLSKKKVDKTLSLFRLMSDKELSASEIRMSTYHWGFYFRFTISKHTILAG